MTTERPAHCDPHCEWRDESPRCCTPPPEPPISTKAEEVVADALAELYGRMMPHGYYVGAARVAYRKFVESGELVPAIELRVANDRAAEYRREASLRETERDVYRQEAKNQQDRVYEVQDEFDRVHTERDELRAERDRASAPCDCCEKPAARPVIDSEGTTLCGPCAWEQVAGQLRALLQAIAEHREAVKMAANRARSSDRDVLREAAEADAALYAKADKIRRGESDQYAKHFRETVARIVAELERVQSLQGMEKEGKR